MQVFNEHQIKFLSRMIRAVQKRAQSSLDLSGEVGVTVLQIMQLLPLLEKLPENVPAEFPIEVYGKGEDMDAVLGSMAIQAERAPERAPGRIQAPQGNQNPGPEDEYDEEEEDDGGDHQGSGAGLSSQEKTAGAGGTLQPRKRFPTHTGISILIDKIRLKDADQYFEPTVTVTIHAQDGSVIAGGEAQVSAFPSSSDEQHLVFQQEVHLQIPFELIPKDAAVFFEFKHFKPARNKVSTKCFSFLEQDELERAGNLPMELYQKPTDTRRRKLTLVTDKAFYLHVTITRHENGN
jgi:hypothetical protein